MSTVAEHPQNENEPRPAGVYRPNYVPVGHDLTSVTEKISDLVLTRPIGLGWLGCFGFSNVLVVVLLAVVAELLIVGVGIWGIQIPNGWGFAITDFVWWIGIGHAGTLISAFLLLMHQKWRTSINRIAEAMTIFAVMCAGLVPLAAPRPPVVLLLAAAVLQHDDALAAVSQRPDLRRVRRQHVLHRVAAVLVHGHDPRSGHAPRPRQGRLAQIAYGMLALGWRNSARHWHRFEMAYLLLAGLATPLVISVHSVVSADFAVSVMPAWHETVFPPYFVAGAIFSGFAMVLLLCIPIRHVYHLKEFITIDHLDVMGKLVLATSLVTSFGYLSEQSLLWYAHDTVEWYTYWFRISGFGQYGYITWLLFFCNTIVPQVFWFRRLRRKEWVLALVSVAVLIGMWLERYMIITTSLSRDYLPSSWGFFTPTVWDFLTFFGSTGIFMAAFLLFARLAPLLSMSEIRASLPGAHGAEVGR